MHLSDLWNPVDKAEQQNDLRKEGIDLTQELAAKMRDYDDVLFPEGYQKIKDLEALIAKLTAENKQKMAMKDQQINDLNKKIEELEKPLSKSDAKLNQWWMSEQLFNSIFTLIMFLIKYLIFTHVFLTSIEKAL